MDTVRSKNAIYLSGAIEASNGPWGWREHMSDALSMYYNIIIPDKISCPYTKDDAEFPHWFLQNFFMPDMHSVATSRHCFVLLDEAVFKAAGTISELSLACWLGKEIVYVIDGLKKNKMPGWVLGCLANGVEMPNIDEAIEYYKGKAFGL